MSDVIQVMPAEGDFADYQVGDVVSARVEGAVNFKVGDVSVVLDNRCVGVVKFNGEPVPYVRKVTLTAEVGCCPVVTIERVVMPEKT